MGQVYGELIRADLQNSASDLTNPGTGNIYFNTTVGPKWYNGAVWLTAADLSTAQTLTNKTLTAPKIDQVLLIEGAAPSTPASGHVALYTKVDKKLYSKDSTGVETAVGSGSGSGEINTVESPNDANGWVASGAGITVATSSTLTDLPLGPVVDTSIKITPVSGTDYVYYRFTIPAALKQRKLKLEWHQRPLSGYASGDIKVDVYKNAASNYGGAYTRFTLSTDVSSVTGITNQTGKFTTYLDADDADYYEIRFVRVAGTTALNLAGVVFGPGIQAQGAIVEADRTDFTTFFTLTNMGTTSIKSAFFKRVGDRLQGRASLFTGTLPAAPPYLQLIGLTLDSSRLLPAAANSYQDILGHYHQPKSGASANIYDGGTGTSGVLTCNMNVSTSRVYFCRNQGGQEFQTFNANDGVWASNSYLNVEFDIPIAEWAGSGTVNVAQNDVEIATNASGGTWDADGTAGQTSYDPTGSIIAGPLTATRTKVVRFPTPVQKGDRIVLEIDYRGDGKWVDSASIGLNVSRQNTVSAGCGAFAASGSTTDFDVIFFQYADFLNTATYGGAGRSWNSFVNGYWRLKKIKAGAAVGFGIATTDASGLIPAYETGSFSLAGSGSFTGGTVYYTRIGNLVTLAVGSVTHASASSCASAAGAIPASLRPLGGFVNNLIVLTGGPASISRIEVASNGTLTFVYYDAAFATVAKTGVGSGSVSYPTTYNG